jgi:hypothetical protein
LAAQKREKYLRKGLGECFAAIEMYSISIVGIFPGSLNFSKVFNLG